ncbi:MAG: hypothetical protein AB7G54_00440 [Methyloceanibacter sp.]
MVEPYWVDMHALMETPEAFPAVLIIALRDGFISGYKARKSGEVNDENAYNASAAFASEKLPHFWRILNNPRPAPSAPPSAFSLLDPTVMAQIQKLGVLFESGEIDAQSLGDAIMESPDPRFNQLRKIKPMIKDFIGAAEVENRDPSAMAFIQKIGALFESEKFDGESLALAIMESPDPRFDPLRTVLIPMVKEFAAALEARFGSTNCPV